MKLKPRLAVLLKLAAHFAVNLVLLSMPVFAQSPAAGTSALPAAARAESSLSPTAPAPLREQLTVPASIHGTLKINNGWRFHIGDDPAFANPGFDDSGWTKISLDQTLAEQGIDTYTGYAWYRLRLRPVPIPDSGHLNLAILAVPNSVGQMQIFANSTEIGHTRGLQGDKPAMYQSPPLAAQLGDLTVTQANLDGTVTLAIRTWAGSPVTHGILDHLELGDPPSVGDKFSLEKGFAWDQHVLASLLVSFLYLSVTLLGATLFLAQRSHSEYLWLALLCLSVTLTGLIETAFGAALLSFELFSILSLWTGRIFIAVTLEFALRFTAAGFRRTVRVTQVAVLLVPLLSFLPFRQPYEAASIASEIFFCALVTILLFRAWRRGRVEAGVMLVPFFLAATAGSLDTVLDYAAYRHWLSPRFASHQFHLGPLVFSTSTLAFLIFLGSLIAVILYRFVHVSQEEQRSAAEIDAARSVQALLIPTQLPSNRSFVMESAYLPANGVGGDFFQALPLKDDSMLIVVGDVSGKGLQAAMNASTLVGALRNELSHDPATVLSHLNQVMLGATADSPSNQNAVAGFATCLCARIYPSGEMTIANAGHLSPYRDGRELELAACLPLGIIPNVEYEQTTFKLKHGDRLTFISDGVVEATDTRGELFGFERTQQVAHESARYIAQTAQHFGQTDDITVVSLYFVPA